MQFSNGLSVKMDDVLGKVFFSENGETSTASLHDMFLAAADNDEAAAQVMRQRFHDWVTGSEGNMGFGEGDSSTLTEIEHFPDGSVGAMVVVGPPGGNSNPCGVMTVSCYWTLMSYGYDFYLYWNYGWPDAGPSDPLDWDDWHQHQCDHVGTSWIQVAGINAGAVGTCVGIGETGVGTAVCFTAAVAAADASHSYNRQTVNCHSTYVPH